MEHFKNPFGTSDLASARAVENLRFFEDVLERAKNHRYFSHPFMSAFESASPSRNVVAFILTSMYKLVSPFTGLLCSLGGQAPNLSSRFMLMDNLYEEMGCGDLEAAHPSLYLKMLESIGVREEEAEGMQTLPSIQRINGHLREVVEDQPFSVACAILALAEAVIPPTFPVLVEMACSAFPDIDMTFFDRHGHRDDGHSADASVLFALSAESSQFPIVEAEMRRSLDYRSELFDEWMLALGNDYRSMSERVSRYHSTRPPASHHSARPPASHQSVPPPA